MTSEGVGADSDGGTGYRIVDTRISCVLTRFRVRSAWSLLRFYRSYVRIRMQTRGMDGLLASLFLLEDRHTCYTLSLWRDSDAILAFNGGASTHIDAANQCFQALEVGPNGPQIWSAQFRLAALSPHNLRWNGVDIAPFVQHRRARSEGDSARAQRSSGVFP